ncbi:MAG: TetR/AcrR family transcriptional regulator [Bacillota bacterium]|uniref:TetR/AcrR family transcriptional regulator n=1 Tax=Bacillus sp. RO2 TaxID=2723913 RepID=UPI00145F8BE1|nr:TetR/AcrR family transcriptional regulator [Bacillus sp. RO2]MEA3321334.1 TetR/AcrR family transcriptional regulator [Bacillota bacterium]NMH73776.1 TetR/AcrR family transcriptional regulator [Bacillus sp. RO2]
MDNQEEKKLSEKHRKILEAAIETFAEKGYAATSTNEIAKKAGVAEGTIFRHYKTKKELLLSIVSPTVAKFIAPHFVKSFSKEVLEGEYNSYEEFLRNLAYNRYEFIKQNFPILKIFIQEVAFHEEFQKPYFNLFREVILPNFTKVVVHFQEKGELKKLPPDTIIRFTISTIAGTIFTQRFLDPSQDFNQELETAISFLMDGLNPGPRG